jgi:hypothetical protein
VFPYIVYPLRSAELALEVPYFLLPNQEFVCLAALLARACHSRYGPFGLEAVQTGNGIDGTNLQDFEDPEVDGEYLPLCNQLDI